MRPSPCSSQDGEDYVLGLCEGNHCKEGKTGKERGQGRIVVMRKKELYRLTDRPADPSDAPSLSECVYDTISVIRIPSSANFQDYSGINIRGDSVLISSQEDSAVWVGKIVNEEEVRRGETGETSQSVALCL